MPEFSVSTSFGAGLLFAGALAAGLLAWFAYRVTIPPIPPRIRILLMSLRGTGLFFLFLLIGSPLLSLLRHTTEAPVTLLLLDNSRSMTITDKSGIRSEHVRAILENPALSRLSEIGDVRAALFDSRTHFLDAFAYDSLTFAGEATDLSEAFHRIKQSARSANLGCILLISDGIITTGASPLFEADDLNLPVFAIGTGDTTEQRDILVRNVITNTVVYAGTRVPVNVTLKSSGYGGQRVEVLLRSGSAVADRQVLTLQDGTRDYGITLNNTPDSAGLRKYTVEVSNLPDELTDRNNRISFFTRVLKSKMKVLLIAGGPSADLAFVKRSLESDENITVSTYLEQLDGSVRPGPLSAALLNDQDCLITIGIPRASTSIVLLEQIAAAAIGGKPLLFMSSRLIDLNRLAILEPALPFLVRASSAQEIPAFIAIPDFQLHHVILRRSTTGTPNPWSQLPPLFQTQRDLRAKPESEVLGFTRIQNVATRTPMLVLRNVNRRKSLALTAYGLWRWSMLSDQSLRSVPDEFLSNAIRWLTTRDDDRKVRVAPTRDFFSNQDPVEFVGQIYDDSFQPLDEARIAVTIRRGDQQQETVLNPLGNGQYEGRFESLPEGDYTYAATVLNNGATLARETGSFSIGGLATEFRETRANTMLLRQLAARTGGMYFDDQQLGSLPDQIRSLTGFRSREVTRSSEYELWNLEWSLWVLLLLFSLEWFVRKRFAML